jgi:hypothetical protein
VCGVGLDHVAGQGAHRAQDHVVPLPAWKKQTTPITAYIY